MSLRWGSRPWKIWRSHWRNQKSMSGLRLPIALIMSILIFGGLGYLATNRFADWRDWQAFDPTTGLDTWIPVIPWMIVPYSTLYFYYPMAALLGMKNTKTQRENVIFHQIVILLALLVYVVFILLPVEVDLRARVFEAELGIWQSWYDSLYGVDTPWNAWPSLHIVQSLLAVLVVNRWYEDSENQWLIRCLWFAWLMLTISVMTTKQHFVWDVVTGIIVAVLTWKYWMKPSLDGCHDHDSITRFDEL
mgnify:FL=1